METQPYFRIDDERPGSLLRITWRGAGPSVLFRWAPHLVAILLFAALGILIGSLFGNALIKSLANGQFLTGETLPVGIIVVVGGVMGYQIVRQVAKFCQERGQWTELTWDRHRGTFTALFDGIAFGPDRSLNLPLDAIESCHWTIGPESGEPLQLTLEVNFNNGRLPLELRLDVDQVDQRLEAFDLLLKLGRVADHSHFLIHSVAPDALHVATYHNAHSAAEDCDDFDDEEQIEDPSAWPIGVVTAIPAATGPADHRSSGGQRPLPSGAAARKFDRNQWTGEFSTTRLAEWKPGERIELVRDGWPSLLKWIAAVFAGLLGAFVFAGPLFGIAEGLCRPRDASRLWVAGVVFVVAASSVRLFLRPLSRRRTTLVDWRRGSLSWREGPEQFEASLRDVKQVTVGAPNSVRTRDSRSSPFGRSSQCEVQVVIGERAATIAELDNLTRGYEEALATFYPFAQVLARSLGVPCRVMPRDPDLSSQRRWRPNRAGWYVFATIMTLVLIAQGHHAALSAVGAHRAEEARARLVSAGVKVEHVDVREIGGGQEIEDLWRVEFPEGVDDAKLTALLPDLAAAGRVYLDLHESAVTDVAALPLGHLGNLVGLDLSDTAVSTDGTDQFYRLNDIEYLNLSRTRVTDNGVSICAMNGKLKVLRIDGTYTTDGCMLNLRICDSLKLLGVSGTRITAQGESDLRGALPRVQIVRLP